MSVLPSLRQLSYLVAIAEHRHFGRAAEACLVTQSTLSAGLQELERLLGVQLVERTRRRVMITPLGTETVSRARTILALAQDLSEAAQAARRPLSNRLRLGVIPTIGPYILPRVLPEARALYPELKLYLREEQTAAMLDSLRSGRIDTGLLALPYETGDLEVMELGAEPLRIAVPRGHPLDGRRDVAQDDLAREPLLMLEDGHCLRDHALTACRLASSRGNEVFQATSLSTLVEMVAGGLGVTLVPEMAVEREVTGKSEVGLASFAGDPPGRKIAMVWRPHAARAEEFRLFGEVLKMGLGA